VKIGFGAKKHKLWGRLLSEGTRGFSSLVENEVHENFCGNCFPMGALIVNS
jgi:hypothetical protein